MIGNRGWKGERDGEKGWKSNGKRAGKGLKKCVSMRKIYIIFLTAYP
jgi:hypothetical protein